MPQRGRVPLGKGSDTHAGMRKREEYNSPIIKLAKTHTTNNTDNQQNKITGKILIRGKSWTVTMGNDPGYFGLVILCFSGFKLIG